MRHSTIAWCILLIGNSYALGQNGKSGSIVDNQAQIGNNQEVNESFSSSDLPILVIETTNHASIVDDPKITAHMGIIFNDSGKRNNVTDAYNNYNGQIGIELRGNSTQSFPKKPYLFETRDLQGNNLDTSLLGLSSDNDWILLASYIDRTFIRDPLAHYLSNSMGQWSSHSKYCELVINGEYQGIYILIESIKQGKNRVPLNKLKPEDTSGDAVTGGYIYEITGFGGDFGQNRKLHYPKLNEIAPAQLQYIRDYDDLFRYVMNQSYFNNLESGYYNFIHVSSFINEIIVQETMRNSDAYGWSGYFCKDKNNRLDAGPSWDFDQSTGNSSYKDGANTEGLILDTDDSYMPFFWKKLFYEPKFRYMFRIEWEEMRKNKFKTENIFSFIDSCANVLGEAQQRNFQKWPVLGVFVWRETSGYQYRDTYQKEVDYLKSYLSQRLSWIDQLVAGIPEVPLYSVPGIAGNITGDTVVCKESSNIAYTVPPISGASSYIWTLPAGTSGTSTTNTIYVTINGIASSDTLKVKGHNNCGDGGESYFLIHLNDTCIASGTHTLTNRNECKVYPNPTSGIFNVTFDIALENDSKVEIFNLTTLMKTEIIREGQISTPIDISKFPSGVYVIKVSVKNKTYHANIMKY